MYPAGHRGLSERTSFGGIWDDAGKLNDGGQQFSTNHDITPAAKIPRISRWPTTGFGIGFPFLLTPR